MEQDQNRLQATVFKSRLGPMAFNNLYSQKSNTSEGVHFLFQFKQATSHQIHILKVLNACMSMCMYGDVWRCLALPFTLCRLGPRAEQLRTDGSAGHVLA